MTTPSQLIIRRNGKSDSKYASIWLIDFNYKEVLGDQPHSDPSFFNSWITPEVRPGDVIYLQNGKRDKDHSPHTYFWDGENVILSEEEGVLPLVFTKLHKPVSYWLKTELSIPFDTRKFSKKDIQELKTIGRHSGREDLVFRVYGLIRRHCFIIGGSTRDIAERCLFESSIVIVDQLDDEYEDFYSDEPESKGDSFEFLLNGKAVEEDHWLRDRTFKKRLFLARNNSNDEEVRMNERVKEILDNRGKEYLSVMGKNPKKYGKLIKSIEQTLSNLPSLTDFEDIARYKIELDKVHNHLVKEGLMD